MCMFVRLPQSNICVWTVWDDRRRLTHRMRSSLFTGRRRRRRRPAPAAAAAIENVCNGRLPTQPYPSRHL